MRSISAAGLGSLSHMKYCEVLEVLGMLQPSSTITLAGPHCDLTGSSPATLMEQQLPRLPFGENP